MSIVYYAIMFLSYSHINILVELGHLQKVTFGMEAARNFYELPEDTLEERDGTSIQQRTRDIEEENGTSPVCYNDADGGFSICKFHTNRFDPQDESDELSEDSEEETIAGSSYERDAEIEEDVVSAQPV